MRLRDNTTLQGGKYRITRYIAHGGFGITYEGVHVLFDHKVAIKEFFISDFCHRDDNGTVGANTKAELVDRLRGKFIAEACALHTLNHPGIVKVHDVFEENGTAYYVMDYIDGESLASMVKQIGRLPETTVRKYLNDIAEALSYLHGKSRLHLDIKPANIMIDRSTGRAVLIDFGVSKQYDEVNGQNTSTLVGKTPGYAPIEQLNSEVQMFTPATDIYALAATLYNALSGITPPSPSAILENGLPALPASVSEPMRRIIHKGLQLNRKDRYQSIAEMMADLNISGPNNNDEVTVIDSTIPKPINPSPDKQKEKSSNRSNLLWLIGVIVACAVVIGIALNFILDNRQKRHIEDYNARTESEISDLDSVFDPNNITQADLDRYANIKNEKFDNAVDWATVISEDPDTIYNFKLYLANKGYSDACWSLGAWYENATGPGKYKKKDLSLALEWYKKGAALDDMGCANSAAKILEDMGQLNEAFTYYSLAKDLYYKYRRESPDGMEYFPPNSLNFWSTPSIWSVDEAINRTNPDHRPVRDVPDSYIK